MSHIIYTHRGKRYGVPFSLIARQEIEFESLTKIIALQKEREDLMDIMRMGGLKLGALASKQVTQIEYELQELWGFPLDFNYHRHWQHPGCTCPKLNNECRYPHGAIVKQDCPLHKHIWEHWMTYGL